MSDFIEQLLADGNTSSSSQNKLRLEEQYSWTLLSYQAVLILTQPVTSLRDTLIFLLVTLSLLPSPLSEHLKELLYFFFLKTRQKVLYWTLL